MANRTFLPVDMEESMDDNRNDISNCLNGIQSHSQRQLQMQHQHQQQQQPQTLLKRSEMNALIMDYLVHEGFKEAAERFSEEAGIEPQFQTDLIDKRIKIRQLIEGGDILRGQSLLNSYYPELLDNHRDLYFRLQQQHLIELIRQQKISEVLAYVHDQLRVEELDDLSEMERTLALLAYEQPDKSPYANLLQASHRLQLASEINDIILQESSGNIEPTKPRLVTLIKLLFWSQSELEKKKVSCPKMNDLFRINGNSSSGGTNNSISSGNSEQIM